MKQASVLFVFTLKHVEEVNLVAIFKVSWSSGSYTLKKVLKSLELHENKISLNDLVVVYTLWDQECVDRGNIYSKNSNHLQ